MKDVKLYTNTTEENKRWLEQRVEDLGCSLSEYIHELIQKHIDIVSDSQEYPYNDSERLQTVVEDVHDETDILLREFWGETTREGVGTHRPGHLQLVVLWRLLAGEYSATERQYAIQLARDYIGDTGDIAPEALPAEERWRDTTPDEELLAADFMTSDTGSDAAGSGNEQDTDETVTASQFMTADGNGDSDE